MRVRGIALTCLLLGLGLIGCFRSPMSSSYSSSGNNEIEVRDLKPDDASGTLVGTWSAHIRDRSNQYLQLTIIRQSENSSSASSFGWSDAELQKMLTASGPVSTSLKRDAGTLALDGTIEGSNGQGKIVWTPDSAYVAEIANLTGETITPARSLELGLANLELDYAKRIVSAGYKVSTSELLGLKFAGVTADYAVGMHDAGYSFTADELRSIRFAGITVNWAKEYRQAGYDFGATDLRSLRFAGVTADYAAGFKKAGYSLTVDELRSLHFAGVPSSYAETLGKAGYKFTPDELRSLRFAGVPAEYAASLKTAGYNFSSDELRRLCFSGVPAEYAVAAATPGRQHLSAEELIQLRFKGVSADTIHKLRQ